MQASTGRLYLGFWSLSLRNLPIGSIRHRLIDADTAGRLIRAARAGGTLRCGSSEDLVAPRNSKRTRRHARLCGALSNHLNIPITQDEFLVTGEEGLTHVFPLGIVQLDPGDQLLVVDCGYRMTGKRTADFEDRFEVAEDSIQFHLFESDANRLRLSDTLPSADANGGAQIGALQGAAAAVIAQRDVIAPEDELRADLEAADSDDGFVPIEEADALEYPCVASAFLDYYATGEGRTIGIIVMQASCAEDLRRAVRDEWDPYFEVDVRVRPWQGLLSGFEALDPGSALALLDRQFAHRPSFKYSATLHFNGA